MKNIYLDTNQLYKKINSAGLTRFFKLAQRYKFSILIPEIVIDETIGKYTEDIKEDIKKYENSARKLSKTLECEIPILNLEDQQKDFQKNFNTFIKKLNPTILDYPNVPFKKSVQESYLRKKPFKRVSKILTGYKDYYIWETIKKSILEHQPSDSFYFLTSNSSDFSNSSKNFMHPDLLYNLPEEYRHLKYYSNLYDFIKAEVLLDSSNAPKKIYNELSNDHIRKYIYEFLKLNFQNQYLLKGRRDGYPSAFKEQINKGIITDQRVKKVEIHDTNIWQYFNLEDYYVISSGTLNLEVTIQTRISHIPSFRDMEYIDYISENISSKIEELKDVPFVFSANYYGSESGLCHPDFHFPSQVLFREE